MIVHDRGLAITAQTFLSSVARLSIARTHGMRRGDSSFLVDAALFMSDILFPSDSRFSPIRSALQPEFEAHNSLLQSLQSAQVNTHPWHDDIQQQAVPTRQQIRANFRQVEFFH